MALAIRNANQADSRKSIQCHHFKCRKGLPAEVPLWSDFIDHMQFWRFNIGT